MGIARLTAERVRIDRAVRAGRWKLVHQRAKEGAPMLFDLEADIAESTDLAAQQTEVVERLLALLDAWESELVEPHWGPGAPKEPLNDDE